MSNEFEFGIGITANDEGATDKFRGVITDMESHLENSFDKFDLNEIFGKGFDPSLLKFDDDAIKGLIGPLTDISQTLQQIAKDTRQIAGAFGDAGSTIEDTAEGADVLLEEICGVVICLDNAAAAAAGLGDSLSEVPQQAETVKDRFGKIGKAADMLKTSNSLLRFEQTRLNRAMGATALEADTAAFAVLRTAKANKVAWKDVSDLSIALSMATIDMDALDKSGQRQMDTMVQLKETFFLSDGQIQSLAGSMKMTGGSITDLSGVAVQFQKDFKVPALINTLPAAAKAAIDAQSQFGSLVGKSSRDITVNILRMTGVYSRALGVTAAEAANKARSTFMKFTGEVESFEDLFLGLADDFTPLQTAFLETGISMEEMEDLMRKGADAPGEFADEVNRIADSLDPQMGERFRRQVLRNVDESVAALIQHEEAAKGANEAIMLAGVGVEPDDPSKVFNDIAKAMRENATDAEKMHKALGGVANELGKLMMDEGVRQGLELVNTALQTGIGFLITQAEKLRNNEKLFGTYNAAIALTTVSLVALDDAWKVFTTVTGNASTVVGGLIAGLVLLKLGFRTITKPIRLLWRIFRTLGLKAAVIQVGRFAKVIGKAVAPIGLAIAAFSGLYTMITGIADVISDPKKTGWEAFSGIVGATFNGIWDFLDTFLLGIPGRITKALGVDDVKAGINELGVWFGEWAKSVMAPVDRYLIKPLTKAIDSITDYFGEKFGVFTKWLSDEFPEAAIEMAHAWKGLMLALGVKDEEAERQKESGALADANKARDLMAQRTAGTAATDVDVRAGELIATQLDREFELKQHMATMSKAEREAQERLLDKHGIMNGIEFRMAERMATMSKAEREAQEKHIALAAKTGFVGAREEILAAATLLKAFKALQESGGKLTTDIAERVGRGGITDTGTPAPKDEAATKPDVGIETKNPPSPTAGAPVPPAVTSDADATPAPTAGVSPADVAAGAGTVPAAAMAAAASGGLSQMKFSPTINNRFYFDPSVNRIAKVIAEELNISLASQDGQGHE